MALSGRHLDLALAFNILIGLISATLISSSNYVINEILDAPFDRLHPTKKNRPAACGLVHIGWGYTQWILMMLAGLALARMLSLGFLLSALALWVMGCIYNISPVRSKDLPYVDVLSESVNNPLRFCSRVAAQDLAGDHHLALGGAVRADMGLPVAGQAAGVLQLRRRRLDGTETARGQRRQANSHSRPKERCHDSIVLGQGVKAFD